MAKVVQFCPMTSYPIVTLAYFSAVFRQIGLRSLRNAWCSNSAKIAALSHSYAIRNFHKSLVKVKVIVLERDKCSNRAGKPEQAVTVTSVSHRLFIIGDSCVG